MGVELLTIGLLKLRPTNGLFMAYRILREELLSIHNKSTQSYLNKGICQKQILNFGVRS